jgi:hypothetical protein
MKNILSASVSILLLSASLASAQTIIYDDFSNPNVPLGTANRGYFSNEHPAGTSVDINGLTPANGSTSGNYVAGADLPGTTWVEAGGNPNDGKALEVAGTLTQGSTGATSPITFNNYADVGFQRSVATIGLGSYNTTPTLTLSAYVRPTSSDGGTSDNVPDGAFLGYSSSTGTAVGVLLSVDGSLTLDAKGNVQDGSNNDTTIAYTGSGFNPLNAYLLTYTIDTTTGNITNVSLQGSTSNYSGLETASAGDFLSTNIANVQLGTFDRDASNGQGAGYYGGEFANLSLIEGTGAVPEPSTWALLAGSLIGLIVTMRRRQQHV